MANELMQAWELGAIIENIRLISNVNSRASFDSGVLFSIFKLHTKTKQDKRVSQWLNRLKVAVENGVLDADWFNETNALPESESQAVEEGAK